MQPKRFFTTERSRFLLIMSLVCGIGVGVSQHSLMRYNIPFVGWILAVGEYRHAKIAYWQAIGERVLPSREYYATQAAYDHTHIASLSTLTFLALCLIVINQLCHRNAAKTLEHPSRAPTSMSYKGEL